MLPPGLRANALSSAGPHKCWKGQIDLIDSFWVDMNKGEAAWGAGNILCEFSTLSCKSCCVTLPFLSTPRLRACAPVLRGGRLHTHVPTFCFALSRLICPTHSLCMYYAKSGFSLPTETATTVKPPQNNQRSTGGVSFAMASLLLLLWPLQLCFF